MNNDLINRSELLEVIAAEFLKTDPTGEEQLGYLACSRIIREFPAADDVEVVRCKDCKWFKTFIKHPSLPYCGKHFGTRVDPDFFCAGGEKRLDGGAENGTVGT